MLRQISRKRQITLPPGVLKDSGVKPGDYFEIIPKNGNIILIPKTIEDKFLTDEEWDNLDKLVKKQRKERRYTRFTDPEDAKRYARELMNDEV